MEKVENNKMGRPTKYKGIETINIVKKYLEDTEDEEYRLIRTDGTTSTTYENKLKVKIPTIEGLALILEVNLDTVYEWEKHHKEFSEILGNVRKKQAKVLIEKGLSGDYNSTIAKVLLTKHGYREGIEQTGKDGKDLMPEQQVKIDKAIDNYLSKLNKTDGNKRDTNKK